MENKAKVKRQKKQVRHRRIRAKVAGTAKRPRLSVFRSNKHIYSQLIDDNGMITLVSASDLEIKKGRGRKKIDLARQVGKLLAQKALEKKIKKIVFDRGSYKFHGKIRQLAEGAKEGGLEF